ncbi:MAG: hypothetical protein VX679_05975 [Pseudomonadota bacterium]|nr:hypothetical protein [Pseudomonadota bacterium]
MSNNDRPPDNFPDEITIILAAGTRQPPREGLQTMLAAFTYCSINIELIIDGLLT